MNTATIPAELKLSSGGRTITVRPRNANAGNPVHCKEWDLGAPEVRVNSVPAPGSDGTFESTPYLGSRTVSLTLQIVGGLDENTGQSHDAYWYLDQLTAMSHPRAATYLEISRDSETTAGATYRMALRGNPWSTTFSKQSASYVELNLNFTCPLGLIEGPLRSLQSQAAGRSPTGQWTFPAALPKSFGFTSEQNPLVHVVVGGTSPITPTVYISGPCTDPAVDDGTETFAFSGLKLAAGETVQIDMAAGTVLLGTARTGADPDRSVYNLVDWSRSSFWTWPPGAYDVRFTANGGTTTIQWRERQLSI